MTFKERYQYDPNKDLLGRGGFSKVFKAQDQMLDRPVALKFFTSGAGEKYNVLSEIKRVINFQHKHIVRYYDVAEVEAQGIHGEMEKMQVGIMEYVNSGDLYKFLKSKPDGRAFKEVVAGILKGLQFIHSKNLIHRDIKPENILMNKEGNEWIAKIADFGISKEITKGQQGSSALMGTVEYMAPEQFNPKQFGINGTLTTNVDLWSFGVILHETFSGQPYFGKRSQGVSMEQIMRNIYEKGLPIHFENVPEPYQSIIKRCIVKNAAERAQDAGELLDLLEKKTTAPIIARTPTAPLKKPTGSPGTVGAGKAPEPARRTTSPVPHGKATGELKWNKQQTPSGETAARKKTNPLVFIIPLVILLLAGGAFAVYKFSGEKSEQTIVTDETGKPEEVKAEVASEPNVVKKSEEEQNEKRFIDLVATANTYVAQQNYERAKEYYEKAKELKSDNPHVNSKLSQINDYFKSQGDKIAWDQAQQVGTMIAFQDFLNKHSSGEFAQKAKMAINTFELMFENSIQLGDRKLRANNIEEAEANYEKALKSATHEQRRLVIEKLEQCAKLKAERALNDSTQAP